MSNIVSLSHYRKKVIHMNQKLRNLVYTAMLMALCCVATLVIKIPTVTGGYLNAGQAAVGIVGGLALYFALNKVPQIRDFSEAALAKKQK